jgi:hypothetical protein
MPASGHQDHTISPSASAPFVKGAARVHRIPPHVRDDRETPLVKERDLIKIFLSLPGRQAIIRKIRNWPECDWAVGRISGSVIHRYNCRRVTPFG